LVEDVGVSNGATGEQRQLPGAAPVSVITSMEEDRPAGTTWVFSDGSQVLASSTADDSADDTNAFYDEFERATAGEHYNPTRNDETVNASNMDAGAGIQQQQKEDDMKDFFDEFEKTSGGENFSRSTES